MKIKLVDMMIQNNRVINIPSISNITLGRESADVDVEDKGYTYSPTEKELLGTVSGTHCIIHLESSNPYVVDCDKNGNGTFVNGEPVESTLGTVIENGDTLRLGDYGLQVYYVPRGTISKRRFRGKELPETIDYINGNYRLDLGEICNDSETVPQNQR